ncbi:hypothetical protein BH11PSE6_BH11PSE6_08530 [soil metagenome]
MRVFAATALAAAVLLPSSAFAGTNSSTFKVTTTVNAACQLSPNDINLSAYDPTSSTALTGSSTLAVTCTKGTTATLSFSSPNATGQVMKMKGAAKADLLSYGLYSDAGATTSVIGANLQVTSTDGTAKSVQIYAKVGAGQQVNADGYSDTVTVTAAF